MTPEVEQELSHTLLIELLAYQFASPVRWIETQDVILAEKRTERIVEVGPADTLGGMAKRTLASKYEAYDAALSVQRQILCYNKDAKEIYYDVDPVDDEQPSTDGATSSSSLPSSTAKPSASATAPAPTAVVAAPSSSAPAAAVADSPVSAVDIVRSLVAQKLKKPLTEIPLSKAIKDLVGGWCLISSKGASISNLGIFARQIDTAKRNPWRSWQRIRLNPRKARGYPARGAWRIAAGHVQRAIGKTVFITSGSIGVVENAWRLQHYGGSEILRNEMGSRTGAAGRSFAVSAHHGTRVEGRIRQRCKDIFG